MLPNVFKVYRLYSAICSVELLYTNAVLELDGSHVIERRQSHMNLWASEVKIIQKGDVN